MDNTILELKDISYNYPNGTKALDKINIKITEGQKVVFLGSNGSGKSTAFLHMNGILKPMEGEVLFKGQMVSDTKTVWKDLWKNVGLVFQDPETQVFSPNVLQEISFGPMNLGLSKEEVKERALKTMEEIDILQLKDKATHFLSSGQKKLVSLADVLVMDTEIIILDEPTASLDCKHISMFTDLLNQLSSKGKTIILSTHDVNLAYSWAEYIFVIKDGRVILEGKTENVFKEREILQEAHLQTPWILDVYQHMLEKEKVKDVTIPRSKEELLKLI
ncbi:energy-coupling factor ABC transporter ATP-binding protein [Alkaliphilus peptidifermentans]|uniref:Cobalt/nickel transport system ATP-binding protein n=1 Tax=Alkaliphilus peptidifermentans DSM 18978 TaxID=1120976 RepID=A0A1G5AR85_9FIRM|nr:ATP-binding cassette domain-containing protein [Alkaliphilus peptidifermentans]SCX80382.1 cobalt/nickel transport system ATP-binding protein [Alkaliphilus peptidifermentans DSM 18978]